MLVSSVLFGAERKSLHDGHYCLNCLGVTVGRNGHRTLRFTPDRSGTLVLLRVAADEPVRTNDQVVDAVCSRSRHLTMSLHEQEKWRHTTAIGELGANSIRSSLP